MGNNLKECLMISINPPYTKLILNKYKKVEFRNVINTYVRPGQRVLLYETKNKGGCGKVVGEAVIHKIYNLNDEIHVEKLNEELKMHWVYLKTGRSFQVYQSEIGYGGNYAIKLHGVEAYERPRYLAEFFDCNGESIKKPPQNMGRAWKKL